MLRNPSLPIPARSSLARVASITALGAVALTVLAACASAPLSYLNDRQVTQKAMLHRFPVVVTAIDGNGALLDRKIPIAPGDHLLTADAPPVAGLSQPVRKVVPITIAPCTQYYIAAQRPSAFAQDWDLVVEVTYPVAGCDPAKELQKARVASSSTLQSSPLATIDPAKTAVLPPTGISN